MVHRSFPAMAVVTACLAAISYLSMPLADARAADVKVLTFLSSRPILTELTPDFEQATGHKLTVVYGSVEPLRDRVTAGEVADVLISSRVVLDTLVNRGKIATNGITDVARITISLFVEAGAPKPDIGTVDTLRRSLLASKSIAFTDPARGALAGRSFANALKRMGIFEQVMAKANIIPGLGHDVVAAVVKGEAAIGAGPTNDVTPLPKGIDVLGRLPMELESDVMISAGLLASAPAPDAAAAFIKFLTSPAGAAAARKRGLEP